MTLSPARVSITTTKRRRFLWCAWWTGGPVRSPFRPPDAYSGGARTLEEAKEHAARAAGCPVVEIEPLWARAFIRLQQGLPPFVEKKPRRPPEEPSQRFRPSVVDRSADPFMILGLSAAASVDDIQRAFRMRAFETHPDRGGKTADFIRVKWAQLEALERARKRRCRP
ncbi:MAG: J domain-containing protein [Polyangiaceae bacterium]|nr:J domain-containing protein [Polyangiaceae bacterium]